MNRFRKNTGTLFLSSKQRMQLEEMTNHSSRHIFKNENENEKNFEEKSVVGYGLSSLGLV
ncbi:MAG: hypothetical protein LBL62_03840, partial [Planctomycetaceae bacterium]|jgi:hypothetical protein|nr:hypothetical protein [Planctomycetaceae bacterium]